MFNKKCCATNIYNSKTQWCKNQKDILPLGEDSCYGEQFKTDTHICCFHQKRVYEKTTKTDDECCGSTPYSIKDYYCKNDKELISSNYYMILQSNLFIDVYGFWKCTLFSSTFRRKNVELLSSLRRQRQRLGRLSFLSESISQKLSTVSIWNLEYLFTIKRGTNYNKADGPVICISRVICPCFDIVLRN